MEKRSLAMDSGGTTPYNTVFVDTSLDTHLVMTISGSETVSNLKKKIMYEHPLLFPNIGGINIHALKVKRKGYFYHLSDSMSVKSAFDGISKSWFLSVDASSLEELRGNEHSQKLNSGDIVTCFGMTNNPSTEEKESENDSGKRERKKGSYKSVSLVVATAPSTRDDRVENSLDMVGVPRNWDRDPDTAGVTGQGVQNAKTSEPCFISMKENSCVHVQEVGENNKVTHSSDVDMSAFKAVTVESKINSPELASHSAVEKGRASEDLHTIIVEGKSSIVIQEANNLNKDTRFSRNDNVTFNEGQKFDSDQIARVEEERELSNNNDPNAMPSECTTSNRDESGMNSKVDVTSDLFNAKPNGASGKSSKKRKKSRKTLDPVASGTEHTRGSIIGISSTAPHEPVHEDHSSDKSRKDESILSPVRGEEVLETTVNTSNLATVMETDSVIQNVLESLQDMRKNTVNVENGDEQLDSDHIARVAEERELSNNNDPSAKPSKCTISCRDEIDMISKVDVTSDLLNANANGASGKSSKRRKKSKKTQDPVASGTEHTTYSIIGISSIVPHEPAHKDHSSNNSGKNESILSPVVGEEVSETTANTSSLAALRETDNVIENVLESLQDVRQTTVSVEIGGERSRRKNKRRRNPASKSLPAMQTEDDVNCKDATSSVNNLMDVEVDASPKLTKKTKLVNPWSKNPFNGSNSELANNAVVESNSEGNNEGMPLQDLHGDVPKSGSTGEANNRMEIMCESNEAIANNNFVSSRHKPDFVVLDEMLVDKVIITKGAYNVVKVGKDKKRLDVHSNGPPPDSLTSLKFYGNEGNGGKAQVFNSSTVDLQQSLPTDDGDSLNLQSKTKLPIVSQIEARSPQSNNFNTFNKKSEKATRANAVSAAGTRACSKINKETVASSTSGPQSSKTFLPQSERGNGNQSRVDIRKVSNNNRNGEIVDGSKPKKSLLATPVAIFKDDSDGSCDEVGVDNSDNSTRTPSDNSLSSDYSDGVRVAPESGSYSSERKKSAIRNITKSHSGVRLDTILRRSSRFQAAKLKASQSQLEDTESQPDEFVPDSQAKS